ncbi:MAG: N-acetylmuramoyl-L-alanine amidase [Treponema sp.]|nr:N-acetylmuramoyl-L-alanine amidase [Treponema sp.]
MSKKITGLIFFSIFFSNLFAISLIEKSKELGMSVYYDSLSESGMLEKNGHFVSFKIDNPIILFDGSLFYVTDAPLIEKNQITVSQDFLNSAENFFDKEDLSIPFKVGAIVIDPGHGGKDPGASKSFNESGKKFTCVEKDINLKVGLLLYERLKTSYPDKKVIMTRNTDKFLSLEQRTDIANSVVVGKGEATLFISIHQNSSLNKNASGYEVWYLTPDYRRTVIDKSETVEDASLFPILNSMMEEEYTTESIMIAKFIMDGLQTQIGKESVARGMKAEEWFVVKNSNMPSVLIELGFVSNFKEASLLSNEEYLKKASLGIYNGVSAFITHFERSKGFTSIK